MIDTIIFQDKTAVYYTLGCISINDIRRYGKSAALNELAKSVLI